MSTKKECLWAKQKIRQDKHTHHRQPTRQTTIQNMYLKTDFKTHTPDNKHRTFQIKTSQDTTTETNATDKLRPQTPLKHMTSPSSCEKQAHFNTAYTDTGLEIWQQASMLHLMSLLASIRL